MDFPPHSGGGISTTVIALRDHDVATTQIQALSSGVHGPLYVRIAQQIQSRIGRKELLPGDQLQSEPALAKTFHTSRPTLRQALQMLIDAGVLYRRRGRGTFVRKRLVESPTYPVMGFSEQILRQGQKPSARILSLKRRRMPRVARRIGLTARMTFTAIKRLQLANNEPIALNTYYLVHGDRYSIQASDLGAGSLYEYLRSYHDIHIAESSRTIRAGMARASVAQYLQVAVGSPLLLVERVDYLADGTPIGYAQSQIRGDRYAITSHVIARS